LQNSSWIAGLLVKVVVLSVHPMLRADAKRQFVLPDALFEKNKRIKKDAGIMEKITMGNSGS